MVLFIFLNQTVEILRTWEAVFHNFLDRSLKQWLSRNTLNFGTVAKTEDIVLLKN